MQVPNNNANEHQNNDLHNIQGDELVVQQRRWIMAWNYMGAASQLGGTASTAPAGFFGWSGVDKNEYGNADPGDHSGLLQTWLDGQEEFTVVGLLRVLQKILHEILQQSFTQPNEYLTNLAYHAAPGPTAMIFCLTNAFVEAEATLDLLRDGRAVCKSWARDPNAPGALPGTAASQNALDGVSFSLLALEEGGIATLDENLHLALAAAQRCNKYMDQLLEWIEQQFQAVDAYLNTHLLKTHRAILLEKYRYIDPEPGAAPYNILKAQQILERVMPFTEQQVASALCDVRSLLLQWTTALWGEPIVLTESLGSHIEDQGPSLYRQNDSSGEETVSVSSHRRRRAHAAFDGD
ncbi:unnamed protein product [Symbiodinium sp. KB8]|nr:unnamed protein product [Symbiodinium sp. KB8]